MASPPFIYNDFHAGVNYKDAPYLLDEQTYWLREVQNVQGTTAGALTKRLGLATFATPANPFTSLFPLESTSSLFLIGAASTFLYSVGTGGAVTQIKSGLTSNLRWEFVSAPVVSGQGPLFGMNGTDTPQQWSGAGSTVNWTNASGGTAVPNGKYCLYANNQVFVSGVTATPSRVFWSAISDPTNWDPASLTGAGFMDFDPNDGEAISGLGRVGPYVLVAKPRKLWILVDPATATARRLSDNVGCIAHRSIASGPEGTYFLSEDRGVYITNGSKLTPISDKILPAIQTTQPGLLTQAAGTNFAAHYYLSLPLNGSSNDTVFDWDTTLGSWWKHTFGSNQFAIWHPTGVANLYSAKATAALVDQAFAPATYTDNGAAFTWVMRGPWQSPTFYRRRRFPTPQFRKRMKQIRYDGQGTADLSLAKDFAGTETLVRQNIFNPVADNFAGSGLFAGGGLFGGKGSITPGRVYGQGVANVFSIVFSATSTTADEVTSYTLYVADRVDSQGN